MDINSRGANNPTPRLLFMRPHFTFFAKLALAVIFFSLSILLTYTVFLLHKDFHFELDFLSSIEPQFKNENGILLAGFFSATLLISLTIYYMLFSGLLGRKFQAFSDYLQINKGKKVIKIPYTQIVKVDISKGYFFPSFRLRLRNNKKLRFSVMVERVDYILDSVLRSNPKLLIWERFADYRNKILISDHRIARFQELFGGKNTWITFSMFVFLPIFFVCFLYIEQSGKMVIHSWLAYFLSTFQIIFIVTFGFWTFFYLLVNTWIDRHSSARFGNSHKDKRRDMKYEKKAYLMSYSLVGVIVVAIYSSIYMYDFNRYELVMRINNSETESYFTNAQLYVVDGRFNCTNCRYNLKPGDEIFLAGADSHKTSKQVISRIEVSEEDGRTPASGSNSAQVFLASGDGEEHGISLKAEKINGKVVESLGSVPWPAFKYLKSKILSLIPVK